MNIIIKQDSEDQQNNKLLAQLHKLSNKTVRLAQARVSPELLSILQSYYDKLVQKQQNPIKFLQKMIFELFQEILRHKEIESIQPKSFRSNLQQSLCSLNKNDYEALEEAMQKAQAQIRKHIRIEQQLKIYLDSLEERVNQYESKLQYEAERYNQLYETIREMNEERHKLMKKITILQQTRPEIRTRSNCSMEGPSKQYIGTKKIRNSKAKLGIDRIRTRQQKAFAEGAIHINLSNNIVVNKKGSYDYTKNKPQHVSYDSSVGQLTKTLQMYQPQKRPTRKTSKYKTQTEVQQRKQVRSNSVCH